MLSLLLDQQISPAVAEQIRAKRPEIPILSLYEWLDGAFVGQPDARIIQAAAEEQQTLVTYDLKTVPPLLREWGVSGLSHAGIIFVDNWTVASHDIGGLVRAIIHAWDEAHLDEWTDRVGYLAPAPEA